MNITEFEKIWRQYSNHAFSKDRYQNLLAEQINKNHNKFVCNGVSFAKVDLPTKVQEAFELHKKITSDTIGSWQEIVVDILLFRIENPDKLRKSKISYDIFIEINTSIMLF